MKLHGAVGASSEDPVREHRVGVAVKVAPKNATPVGISLRSGSPSDLPPTVYALNLLARDSATAQDRKDAC